MYKRIFKASAVLGLGALLAAGCKDKEAELLVPKLYFENAENVIEVGESAEMTYDLQSRLTSKASSDVNVSYSILADEKVLEDYNQKYGKEYVLYTGASLESETSTIAAGEIYSAIVGMEMTGLDQIDESKTYLLPVCVSTQDVPVIDGSDVTYFVIKKPIEITTAARFSSSYVKVPISPLNVFTEVTYEAVVNINSFRDNNTVMGCEGVMIMRIGDAGGGTVPRDILQMAGKSEMTWSDNPLQAGKWYHLAFTCNSAGEANLYVNGENVVSGSFTMSADLTAGGADYGFSIGQVPNFMWGSRPFDGYMSEVRLWNVVRTANQIKENMLNVDPSTPGIVAYYKFDGDVNDSSPNGYNPQDYRGVSFETLSNPIVIGGEL